MARRSSLTSTNMWASQQCPDAEVILGENGEQQHSTQLIAISRAMWMYARPRFQSGTRRKQMRPSRGMGGKVPLWLSRIRWIKACLAFTHTQCFCQGWHTYGEFVLCIQRKIAFWQFPKSPRQFFLFFSKGKARKQSSSLSTERPSVAWRDSSKGRGFCDWKMSY